MSTDKLEQMNIVIVGHVDHGKSTLIGRLLADTGSLPNGKLDQIRAMCEINSKPFEYAFLLDALKDEQSQGITIDTARSFFKSKKRHYIIIDAPGHIEFLKNMVTGASRAEAGVLLIDAKEGVRENSRRHGFMLSLLGIKQIVVAVNKMDLANYDEKRFEEIKKEYTAFLKEINVEPKAFVPIAAREGDNLVASSKNMPWYKGNSVLELIDDFKKEKNKSDQVFRFPVQDIYKFTEKNDDRRIIAGTIETGKISVGDEVIFLPSEKTSRIKTIEGFNTTPATKIEAGYATGFTLDTEIYIRPGELMCKKQEKNAEFGNTFKVNIFWLGKKPLVKDKKYIIKCGAAQTSIYLKEIINILDASELTTSSNKTQIDRLDVSECILQTVRPIAFDLISNIESTGRFVIIDDFEIAGGGIITENMKHTDSRIEQFIQQREYAWARSNISPKERSKRYLQTPKLILVTGQKDTGKFKLAKKLEETLFNDGKLIYFLGISNVLMSLSADKRRELEDREEHIRRMGELSHMFNDAGIILITTISDIDNTEAEILKTLNSPNDLIVINVGKTELSLDRVDCQLEVESSQEEKLEKIKLLLKNKAVLQTVF